MNQWKRSVKELGQQFEESKGGVVVVSPTTEDRHHPVQITPDPHCLEFEGDKFQPKAVRRWLWEQRNCRALTREGALLFASYDEAEDTTRVGVGALTTSDAAVRLEKLRSTRVAS